MCLRKPRPPISPKVDSLLGSLLKWRRGGRWTLRRYGVTPTKKAVTDTVVRGSANFPVAEKYSEHGNRRPVPRDSQKHRHFILQHIGSCSSLFTFPPLPPPPPPNSYPLLTERASGRPPEWSTRGRGTPVLSSSLSSPNEVTAGSD